MNDKMRTDQVLREWHDQPGPADREIKFRDVLAVRGNSQKLNEASLGRVYQHFVNSGKESFAIVTAWKDGADEKHPGTNKANMKKLGSFLRSERLGFFELKGHWRAKQPDGSYKDTFEPSLFVPGMSFKQATKIRDQYKQEAVIYAGPETDGEVALLLDSGGISKIGKFHPMKIAQSYSEVKGKPFTFEGFELLPNSFVEAQMAMLHERQGHL